MRAGLLDSGNMRCTFTLVLVADQSSHSLTFNASSILNNNSANMSITVSSKACLASRLAAPL